MLLLISSCHVEGGADLTNICKFVISTWRHLKCFLVFTGKVAKMSRTSGAQTVSSVSCSCFLIEKDLNKLKRWLNTIEVLSQLSFFSFRPIPCTYFHVCPLMAWLGFLFYLLIEHARASFQCDWVQFFVFSWLLYPRGRKNHLKTIWIDNLLPTARIEPWPLA